MNRVPVFLRIQQAVLIGTNDHAPRRVEDLLASGARVTLFCNRAPIALLPQVVDGEIAFHRRLPDAADLQAADAVFIQTGDPATDRKWQVLAVQLGVRIILVENHRAEPRQPETFRCGPLALTLWPWYPLRAIRRFLRQGQRRWRKAGPLGIQRRSAALRPGE